jgi:transposase
MKDYSIFVGLDVHKDKISIAEARGGRSKPEYLYEIPTDALALSKFLKRYGQAKMQFCYEAGPTGYGLYRYLVGKGHRCDVVAPSLVPKKAGDRVKTDRRDAVKLAGLCRAGELTKICVPTEEQEAIRDLTRGREDAKAAEKRAKLTLGSFLLRRGKKYTKTLWKKGHFDWLRTLSFPYVHQQVVFESYVDAVTQCAARVALLEDQMREVYEKEDGLHSLCDALMALRGVSLITALTILAELGDLRRFASARELMAYLGLVPSESTTGNSVSRGSITKAGNGHVRRVLVESAWCYRLPPRKTKHWYGRAKNAPDAIQAIAYKAMVRLHQRYWRLSKRGLRSQKVVVAIARELSGFIWSVAHESYQAKTLPLAKAA